MIQDFIIIYWSEVLPQMRQKFMNESQNIFN